MCCAGLRTHYYTDSISLLFASFFRVLTYQNLRKPGKPGGYESCIGQIQLQSSSLIGVDLMCLALPDLNSK